MTNSRCNIAVVASQGLGDGLILLVLARNLQQQGHNIIFYNNFVAQLQAWIPHITIKPYPDKNQIDAEFAAYDLVIAEVISVVTQDVSKELYPQLAQHYVFVSFAQIDQRLITDHSQRLQNASHDPLKAKTLINIAKCSGILIKRFDKTNSIVKNVALMCEKIMGIHLATHHNGLIPLPNLIFKKYPRRVVIHPLSSKAVKDWSAKKFIRLARELRKQHWEPVFIVSSQERDYWQLLTRDEFAAPVFANMHELASFIYQSGAMIGNDSGVGHLASNVGITTLTIFNIMRRGDQYCRWRPGWANGAVVTPWFAIKLFGHYYWQQFLSVRRVLSAFKQLSQDV